MICIFTCSHMQTSLSPLIRLTELFQSVEDPDRAGRFNESIANYLGLPRSALEEIRGNYQSTTKRKEAYLDTYTHHHPCPSWKKISVALRQCRLYQHANEVEDTYVQGTCTCMYYWGEPKQAPHYSHIRENHCTYVCMYVCVCV